METKKLYPELNDFVQDVYFENDSKFKMLKQFVEQLNDISTEPGMDYLTLQAIIRDSLSKCTELENKEPKTSEFEFINNQIKEMAFDLNNLHRTSH